MNFKICHFRSGMAYWKGTLIDRNRDHGGTRLLERGRGGGGVGWDKSHALKTLLSPVRY